MPWVYAWKDAQSLFPIPPILSHLSISTDILRPKNMNYYKQRYMITFYNDFTSYA